MNLAGKLRPGVIALACALFFLITSPSALRAETLAIVGGTTTVNLNATTVGTLTGLGISFSPLGSATLVGTTATFPITGGSLDTATGLALIQHDGSGLGLTRSLTTVRLENFLINTGTSLLTGRVTVGLTVLNNVPLFQIGSGLSLSLTNEAAAALSSALGVTLAGGTPIGVAAVAPQAVPEPATLGLIGLGLLSLMAARKKLWR